MITAKQLDIAARLASEVRLPLDRLPYTDDFECVYERFVVLTGAACSRHQCWWRWWMHGSVASLARRAAGPESPSRNHLGPASRGGNHEHQDPRLGRLRLLHPAGDEGRACQLRCHHAVRRARDRRGDLLEAGDSLADHADSRAEPDPLHVAPAQRSRQQDPRRDRRDGHEDAAAAAWVCTSRTTASSAPRRSSATWPT